MAGNINSRAVLSEVHVSIWVGRKLDKKVSEEVDVAKQTKTRAGAYHKRLMAGVDSLTEIERVAGEIRTYHYRMTLPWSDSGPRLLPSTSLFEYTDHMKELKEKFYHAVDTFVLEYDNQISAMAFKLGNLFDRNEYPTKEQVARKFGADYTLSPVPDAGDFRVDVGNDAMRELQEEYNKACEARVQGAINSLYEKVYDQLLHAVERLGEGPDGKPNIFRDSLVSNMQDLIADLKRLNLTGDERLEEMRMELASIAGGLTAEELRKDKETRSEVRTRMQEILGKMGGM